MYVDNGLAMLASLHQRLLELSLKSVTTYRTEYIWEVSELTCSESWRKAEAEPTVLISLCEGFFSRAFSSCVLRNSVRSCCR